MIVQSPDKKERLTLAGEFERIRHRKSFQVSKLKVALFFFCFYAVKHKKNCHRLILTHASQSWNWCELWKLNFGSLHRRIHRGSLCSLPLTPHDC